MQKQKLKNEEKKLVNRLSNAQHSDSIFYLFLNTWNLSHYPAAFKRVYSIYIFETVVVFFNTTISRFSIAAWSYLKYTKANIFHVTIKNFNIILCLFIRSLSCRPSRLDLPAPLFSTPFFSFAIHHLFEFPFQFFPLNDATCRRSITSLRKWKSMQ